MYKNDAGKWVVRGKAVEDVKIEIEAREALVFFVNILAENAGGYSAMMSLPPDEFVFYVALNNVLSGMSDVDAVKDASKRKGTSLTVDEFRKWLPELMREFGMATTQEE